MTLMQRRFSRYQHQSTPFFKGNVCCPSNQVARIRTDYVGKSLHRTRRDNHPSSLERATGDTCSLIAVFVYNVGQILHEFWDIVGFDFNVHARVGAHHKMSFHLGHIAKQLQQSDAVYDAT